MKHLYLIRLFALLSATIFFSCEDDPDPILTIPTLENVEVGLNDNGIGVIGRDFHLNADIIAGDKIDLVQIRIESIEGESYASAWEFEKTWEQFKGAKNANLHQHFTIPEDAVEGNYTFTILISDENGTELSEVRSIIVYDAVNLPVDPQLKSFIVAVQENNRTIFNYEKATGDGLLKLGEVVTAQAAVNNVKGNGKMYVVLVNKNNDHRPESIDAIDYSKTIIWNITEHEDIETSKTFTNTVIDFTASPPVKWPDFTMGAENDNNLPEGNPVTALKEWEAGEYYLGVLYQNTTYNMSLFHYIDVELTN